MLDSFSYKVLQNIVDESLSVADETVELTITEDNRQDFQKYDFCINKLHQIGLIYLNRYFSLKGEVWKIKVTLQGYEYLKKRGQ